MFKVFATREFVTRPTAFPTLNLCPQRCDEKSGQRVKKRNHAGVAQYLLLWGSWSTEHIVFLSQPVLLEAWELHNGHQYLCSSIREIILAICIYLFCCHCCTYKRSSFSILEQSERMPWVQVVVYLGHSGDQGWENGKDTTCRGKSAVCC